MKLGLKKTNQKLLAVRAVAQKLHVLVARRGRWHRLAGWSRENQKLRIKSCGWLVCGRLRLAFCMTHANAKLPVAGGGVCHGRTLVGGLELFVVAVCRQGVASSCGAKLGRLGLLPLTTDPA